MGFSVWLETDISGCLLLPQAGSVDNLLHQFVKRLLNSKLGLCTALDKKSLQLASKLLPLLPADFSAGLLFADTPQW